MKDLSLNQRIITHLVYRDIFNAPVSLDDLCNWLSADTRKEIEQSLTILLSERLIETRNHFYCVRGRSEIIDKYPAKNNASKELLSRNLKYLQLLRFVPFIRYVGISGSVAAGNATPDVQGPNKGKADLDIFIITAPYTLWIVFYFVRLLFSLSLRLNNGRHVLCFNYAMDSSFQEVHNKSLFTATELHNLKTIINRFDSFKNLYFNNQWAAEYYPALRVVPTRRKNPALVLRNVLLPITFILNTIFYILFYLSRCVKNLSLKPLVEFSFVFKHGKPMSFLRVCSVNGGYEWSVRSQFVTTLRSRFSDHYSPDLIDRLFPVENMSSKPDPDMTLAFIKYQTVAAK